MNRYLIRIVFKPGPVSASAIKATEYQQAMVEYYQSRIPSVSKVECKTIFEVAGWKKLIDDSVVSFTVTDRASNKVIDHYPKK